MLALVAQENAAATGNMQTIFGMCLPECELPSTSSGAECLHILKESKPDPVNTGFQADYCSVDWNSLRVRALAGQKHEVTRQIAWYY